MKIFVVPNRKTPSRKRKLPPRTLWHFNNLISNYIINIFICAETSNIMDIIERMFTFIDYSETQVKSMIASGILLNRINQSNSRVASRKWKKIHWQRFFFCQDRATFFIKMLLWTSVRREINVREWLSEFQENCATKALLIYKLITRFYCGVFYCG